jgi:hypothetical protein
MMAPLSGELQERLDCLAGGKFVGRADRSILEIHPYGFPSAPFPVG